jgi:hypothetical protein|nr:MAG TPA: hypothetical protein [Caudoviricetes sp.]
MAYSVDIDELKRSISEEVKKELIKELILEQKENHIAIVYKPLQPHKIFVKKSNKILLDYEININNPEYRNALNCVIKSSLELESMPKMIKEQIPIALEITKDFCELVKKYKRIGKNVNAI